MCIISTTEFKNNFGKYIKLGEQEEIEVQKRGVTIFRIIPETEKLVKECKSYFGMLPKGTKINNDPFEKD